MTKTGQIPIKRLSKYVLVHFYYFSLYCVLCPIYHPAYIYFLKDDDTYSIVI